MNRRLALGVGLSAAAIVVAAIVILAVGANGPLTLPVSAGTRYTLHLGQTTNRYRWFGQVIFNFSLASPMTLVGAWASDGPVMTGAFSNGTPIVPLRGEQEIPGCGITYDVTLAPGTWSFGIAALGPLYNRSQPPPSPALTTNVTVTQTIRFVLPAGNATPVAWWAGNATACP